MQKMERSIMNGNGIDPGSKFKVDDAAESMDAVLDDAPAEEVDPASYRDLTKEEVLDRIAKGYKAALDGDHISFEELLAELADEDD